MRSRRLKLISGYERALSNDNKRSCDRFCKNKTQLCLARRKGFVNIFTVKLISIKVYEK